jgi:putative ABC transport system permease protein
MGWLLQDIRYGLRTILKDRAFLFTATLALALGIGSTTAIFSVIDNVLLQPFPYTDGQRLAAITIHDKSSSEPGGRQFFPVPEFLDYQEQNQVFDRSIGIRQDGVLMTGSGAPESFKGGMVTGNTFEFLGVPPLLGRAITPEDAKPGAPPTFVLSYKVWRRRFGLDRSILGKSFILNDRATTLIGVMPPRFAWWGADLWMPMTLDRSESGPNARYVGLLGHLKPGLDPKAAAPGLQILAERLAKVYPNNNYPKKFDVYLQSLVDNVVGRFRTTLYTLLAAVGMLLLIACANVANLLLAKATAREKEFAVRATLGAGRFRLVRQMMVESVLVALAGAAAGCGFAWLELKGLIALLPQYTFPDEADIRLNTPVLLATLGAALLTALLFGLAPALGAAGRDLNEALKTTGRGNSGFRRGRVRNALIVSEVALSLVLLAGAGLLMRSFFMQRSVNLGFGTENVLTTQIELPAKRYGTPELQMRFLRDLLPRFERLPGVVAAAGALAFPPFGGVETDLDVAGKTHSETWKGDVIPCSARFFQTIGLRQLGGRLFNEDDVAGLRKVTVINRTFAAKYFPGENPIGRQVKILRLESAPVPVKNTWFEIVGIVSDIKNHGVRDAVLPEAYIPYSFTSFGQYVLFLRTTGNPRLLAKGMDEAIWAMDSNVVPQNTYTVQENLDLFEFAKPRFGLILFGVFAGIGLILVTVGVYSVISYTVSQQSHEIGIRMALGATAGNVRSQVMLAGLRFIWIGIAVGLVLAIGVGRLLASEIWGISPQDPLTLGGVIALLTLVGLAACYLPSRRATRVDPIVSLRYE